MSLCFSKEKYNTKSSRKPKSTIDLIKRSKTSDADKFFSHSGTPNQKESMWSNRDSLFGDFNRPAPLRLRTECDKDFKDKILANCDASEDNGAQLETRSIKNKASFVAIEAKPDPTKEVKNKNTVNSSAILNEESLKQLNQSESNEHQKYRDKSPKTGTFKLSKVLQDDILKRSKSTVNEEDYDTVIIEEEIFNSTRSKRMPKNTVPKTTMLMKSFSVNTTDWSPDPMRFEEKDDLNMKWNKEIEVGRMYRNRTFKSHLPVTRERTLGSFQLPSVKAVFENNYKKLNRSDDEICNELDQVITRETESYPRTNISRE